MVKYSNGRRWTSIRRRAQYELLDSLGPTFLPQGTQRRLAFLGSPRRLRLRNTKRSNQLYVNKGSSPRFPDQMLHAPGVRPPAGPASDETRASPEDGALPVGRAIVDLVVVAYNSRDTLRVCNRSGAGCARRRRRLDSLSRSSVEETS